MGSKLGFGHPLDVTGKTGTFKSTVVPLALLANIKMKPIPVTISGGNQVTFTLKGSTRPIPLWVNNDFLVLDEDKAYTWVSGVNNILDSNAAASTVTGSTLGIWYFYISPGADGTDDTVSLIPSQTAPIFSKGPIESGPYMHPGTTPAKPWVYVGWMDCSTAATPVFVAMQKNGYTYNRATVQVATTGTWAELDFSASIPSIEGIKVAGNIETGTSATVMVGSSSVENQGVLILDTAQVAGAGKAPFGPIDTILGSVYGKDTTQRGDVNITQIVDVV